MGLCEHMVPCRNESEETTMECHRAFTLVNELQVMKYWTDYDGLEAVGMAAFL